MNSREWSMFNRCYSGMVKNRFYCKSVLFLTLTSSSVVTDGLGDVDKLKLMKINFDVLRKRYEKDFGVPFGDFFRVATLEGNGVIHVLFNGLEIPHEWLVENWNEIHGSHVVDIRSVDVSDGWRAAKYVINQYVIGQKGKKIFGYSRNWVYGGFAKDLLEARRASRDMIPGHEKRFVSDGGFSGTYYPVRYDYFRFLWKIYLEHRFQGSNPEFWRLSPMVNAMLDGNNLLMTSGGGLLHEN